MGLTHAYRLEHLHRPLLTEKLANLWQVGYQGYYSVEHHTGRDEYTEVAIQLALVWSKLEEFRKHGVPE